MKEMPDVRKLAPHSVQVRTGTFRSPEERVIVDKFSRFGILAVPLRLGAERTDHLRMAGIAPVADIQIAPLELQRRIGLDAGDCGNIRFYDVGWDDFHDSADEDCRDGK